MKVFITGATGFVGYSLLQNLNSAGVELLILRRTSKTEPLPPGDKVSYIEGDALKPEGWAHKIAGVDAIINLIGIIREFPSKGITFQKLHVEATQNITSAAINNGITRYLHMSANGVRENASSMYHKTKYEAEEIIKKTGLTYTLFRPSIIFGKRDSTTTMIADKMRMFHSFPCFGDGLYQMQPIAVEDVAEIYHKALISDKAVNQTLHLGGKEPLAWIDFIKDIANAINKKVLIPKVPIGLVSFFAKIFGGFSFFPVTYEQIVMLLEGNTTPVNNAPDYLGRAPLDFKEQINKYLKE